jgi:hypothetical protein
LEGEIIQGIRTAKTKKKKKKITAMMMVVVVVMMMMMIRALDGKLEHFVHFLFT